MIWNRSIIIILLSIAGVLPLKGSSIESVTNNINLQKSEVTENSLVIEVGKGLGTRINLGKTTITGCTSTGTDTVNYIEGLATQYIKPTYDDSVIIVRLNGNDITFADSADYGVYIPPGIDTLSGVFMIQHGCGMEQFGITKPYDLQYQAFAKKWGLAIVETALYGSCERWRDPKSGSARAILRVLNITSEKSKHPELNVIPWLLWGHSGGGYWAMGMLRDYPQRIIAAVLYSPAFDPQWTYPPEAAKVPVLTRHAGKNDVGVCQATSIHLFHQLRKMKAPVSIAKNESQNHNFSYIRYMAIPFYEAVLEQRLIEGGMDKMNDLDMSKAWLGDTLTYEIYSAPTYKGNKSKMCLLPDKTVAQDWREYVLTGTVVDKTPPPAPFDVEVTEVDDTTIRIRWKADADIESGILRFEIFKDNILVGQVPENGVYQGFDTNGDNTYPIECEPMEFLIAPAVNKNTKISVRTINHFNIASKQAIINFKR